MSQRIFTYEQASALLDAVRDRTLAANARLRALREEAGEIRPPSEEAIAERMDEVVTEWAGEIIAMGALPKGIFTVDFDSGRGFYYCWSLDEQELTHYHGYDEGFAGRKPLTSDQLAPGRVVLN